MKRNRWLLVAAFIGLSGCSSRDVELLGEVMQKASEKAEKALGGNAQQFAIRLQSPSQPSIGLAEQVESRLKWDRNLEGVDLVVSSPDQGVIKISGKVQDIAKKQRIMDLAKATIGVDEVVDEIEAPKEEKEKKEEP
ncbi:MAG: BON domain-containing protein [Gemmataceae bacterium]